MLGMSTRYALGSGDWVAAWSRGGYEVVPSCDGPTRPGAHAYPPGVTLVVGIIVFVVGLVLGGLACVMLKRRFTPDNDGGRLSERDESQALVAIRAIVDGVLVPAFAVNAVGRITCVNDDIVREFPSLGMGVDPGTVSASLSEIIQRTQTGEQITTTERVIMGEPPRSLRVTVIAHEEGAIVSLYDVTEDVDFEEARRTFSAAVSHELRTPLARILGLAETLALPDLEDEREELVIQIEHEVDGIRKLIDEMLLLAALDRGRMAVADGVVDASGVTRRIAADARQRRIGRGHEITVDAPDDLDVPVAARLFEVVVQNLVDNALIHGGEDASVHISIAREGDQAVLVVADTGIGIPAQHLPFVFQRFYRGDASRTGPGSGLGLALVKHIVEAHGGTVSAESDGESGTTMQVTLPILD